ncbi:MAG: FtsX-like permease family protein [Bacteroidota bacterium]
MNFEYFFAKRITFQSDRKASHLVIRLSILSIALAVATMEIALSFVQGFETEIQKKVIGFGSHILIGNYYRELDTEAIPLSTDESAIDQVRALPGVESISPYVDRWCIVLSDTAWDGANLKGVSASYDWKFFKSVIKEGTVPDFAASPESASRDVLISAKMARLLNLSLGDRCILLFKGEPPRRRPVNVIGIYETGMEEFDNHLMICDIRLLQRLNRWELNQASGFEVRITDLDEIERLTFETNELMPYQFGAEPITYLYREIFDWLDLQHQNVDIILILMIIVGIINMTSVILILIIERTRTVGILKAVGLNSWRIMKMFTWYAFFMIVIGVILGNILGFGVLASQEYFEWLQVSQEDYFIKVVPVAWVWDRFLFVNIAVILMSTAFMLLPSLVILKISPLRAIRFE